MEGFSLLAYSSAAPGINAVMTALAAVPDPHVRVNATNDFYVPADFHFLWGAYAQGATITRAQFSSPSLRRTFLPEIAPIDKNTLPTSPRMGFFYDDSPIPLDPGEALDANITNTASDRETVLAWIGPGPSKPDTRPFFTLRVTATPTAVAGAWTNGAITFDQTLPSGTYDMVGARFRSTNLLAFRFVFVGGTYRPGAIGYASATVLDYDKFRGGNLGIWGSFKHNAPPTVDFLANAADASFNGELDLVYTGVAK